ncbi:folate-binding protein [Roseicyclus sp. F158]|uniref:Folate-binding protein n=1 Tax=Tropicimonas omnivorans TaxID=3075590 RepID=A0ABU3DHU9_9RHOB|nr:folate-binding protein [Roseicyclus sp. F158]MDT0683300.1 folate-binding protein [Roseicyclus sp. F158]
MTVKETAPGRKVLAIGGADAADFLQGLVTTDVKKLSEGPIYTALLTPQGKYLADFFLIQDVERILLDVAEPLAADLGKRLAMYRLRAKVQIEETELYVLRGLGEAPEGAFADPRDPSLGWRMISATPGEASGTDWDSLRVEAAIPESCVELVPNESYILEHRFADIGGVDFRKGCYVGQEVTARMRHKTELKKGLVQVEVEGDAEPGTPITSGGKPAGTLHTVAGSRGLAYLRHDRIGPEMEAGGARIRALPRD